MMKSRIELDNDWDYPDGERNLIRETSLVILIGFMMFLIMVFAIGYGDEIDAFFTWILSKLL